MKPNITGKYIIGVDLGGTNVRAAISDNEAHILGDSRNPSLAMDGFDITVRQIVKTIRETMDKVGAKSEDIAGIGIGVPGRHDVKTGVVHWSPNFKDLAGQNLLEPIMAALNIPAYMGNDVNVAALGEFRFGVGQGINSMVMLTLGTGVGGGVILDGKLWLGASGGGGEIGHQIVNPNGNQCGCGNFGDLEGEARRDTIVERALRKIYSGRKTILVRQVNPKYYDITPAMIAQAASDGDELCIEVMEETGFYVGIGVANAMNFLNPEMIVVGGGISQAGPVLWDPIMRTIRANALEHALAACEVRPAALGDDAGIMGGIVLVMQEME